MASSYFILLIRFVCSFRNFRWTAYATYDARKNQTTTNSIHIAAIARVRKAIQAEQVFVEAETL